ncbi:methyltransferase [Caulobacter sp. SLTY]|uniref:class I SAM-dependent methyltransferase n=1 Tax=Caulobacter sp. SLTY TaxID=2683262 RepID=UPI0014123996|nr:class I SAM-dependent methyltransferase [Caulobacter sp. SLTY]NBB15627.1 methyltransferase [Caulobacter sp. SLTY]
MKRTVLASAAGALALVLTGAVAAHSVVENYVAALADPARPAADKARDAARKPADVLALAEIKPGDKVADFIMGGGYFTRVFSAAVGPTGRVYAIQPAEFVQFSAQYGTSQDKVAAELKNVTPLRPSLGAVAVPEQVDVIFTAQNYHDMHLKVAPPPLAGIVNKALFNALKPGGVLIVIDHYAADGSGTRDSDGLHRIDIATVKAEVTAAGFVLVEEKDFLRNPTDPRTASVFDDSIKGKTDQFVLKFRKPK